MRGKGEALLPVADTAWFLGLVHPWHLHSSGHSSIPQSLPASIQGNLTYPSECERLPRLWEGFPFNSKC